MNTWTFPDTHHPLIFYLYVSITSVLTSFEPSKASRAFSNVEYAPGSSSVAIHPGIGMNPKSRLVSITYSDLPSANVCFTILLAI